MRISAVGNGWLVSLAVGVVIGASSLFALGRRAPSVAAESPAILTQFGQAESSVLQRLVAGDRVYRGPSDARVTFVEFTDYECPFCERYSRESYPALISKYGDRIKYVIRNFPLTNMHPHAEKAAEAAECAADQHMFWEYHDRLFENRGSLEVSSLKSYAADLGLDNTRFEECLDSGAKAEIVAADVRVGHELLLRGTPTFFVNDHRIVGAQPLAVFEYYIEQELLDVD